METLTQLIKCLSVTDTAITLCYMMNGSLCFFQFSAFCFCISFYILHHSGWPWPMFACSCSSIHCIVVNVLLKKKGRPRNKDRSMAVSLEWYLIPKRHNLHRECPSAVQNILAKKCNHNLVCLSAAKKLLLNHNFSVVTSYGKQQWEPESG